MSKLTFPLCLSRFLQILQLLLHHLKLIPAKKGKPDFTAIVQQTRILGMIRTRLKAWLCEVLYSVLFIQFRVYCVGLSIESLALYPV